MSRIDLTAREVAILNYALFRAVNLLGEAYNIPEDSKNKELMALIMQIAHDFNNTWVAKNILHSIQDSLIQEPWVEAYNVALLHEANKDKIN